MQTIKSKCNLLLIIIEIMLFKIERWRLNKNHKWIDRKLQINVFVEQY